jgi:hypothetical protein
MLCVACVALAPFELKRAAAVGLSRDGELGAATLELLRATGPAAWITLLIGAACWFARAKLARCFDQVFRMLTACDARTFCLRLGVLGVALRLVWIALVPTFPANDFLEYHELAIRLADTGRFITADGAATAFRPPGYPAILAIFYAMLGPSLWIGKLLNVALGAAISILTWRLVAEAAGQRAGRIGGCIFVTVFPSMIGYTSLHSTEVPSTAAMLAAFLFASRGLAILRADRDDRGGGNATARIRVCRWGGGPARRGVRDSPDRRALPRRARAGRDCARGRASRGTVHARASRSQWRPPFVAWGMRNARELGAFVPLSTNGGVNLYFGNNSISNGTGLEMLDPRNDATSGIADEAERNARGMELGLAYWREHPGALPGLFARKIMWLIGTDGVWTRWTMISAEPRSSEGLRRGLAALSTVMWWGLLALAMIEWTLFRARKSSREFSEPLGESMVVYTVVMTALLIGQERYHFPLVPIVCGGAATFLARLAAMRSE